jgi:hypothetical protein
VSVSEPQTRRGRGDLTIQDPVSYRGASLMTAGFLLSILAFATGFWFVFGQGLEAAGFGLLLLGCSTLTLLRTRRPRGVVVGSNGFENRTGMFRSEVVLWSDVLAVTTEKPGILVIYAAPVGAATDQRVRQIVVRGSDALSSLIGEGDGPSLERPIRASLESYRDAMGEPAIADIAPARTNQLIGVADWVSLVCSSAAVLAFGAVGLKAALDLAPGASGAIREVAFLTSALAAGAPMVMVPGWAGPRFPTGIDTAVAWRPASELLPFVAPWMLLASTGLADRLVFPTHLLWLSALGVLLAAPAILVPAALRPRD